MTRRVLSLLAAAVLVTGVLLPGAAAATTTATGARAVTTITIHANNGNFWGYLTSPRPKRCANHRTVRLYSGVPKLGNHVIATAVSSLRHGRYRWSVKGGPRHGIFWARVGRTLDCRRDQSDLVTLP